MTWRAGGIRPWVVQRLSAVFMGLVVILFTFALMFAGVENYSEWHNWLAHPFWNVLLVLFWLSLFAHAWIGIRDVIMDYVHPDGIRFVVLACFGFYFLAMTVWMVKIMLLAIN